MPKVRRGKFAGDWFFQIYVNTRLWTYHGTWLSYHWLRDIIHVGCITSSKITTLWIFSYMLRLSLHNIPTTLFILAFILNYDIGLFDTLHLAHHHVRWTLCLNRAWVIVVVHEGLLTLCRVKEELFINCKWVLFLPGWVINWPDCINIIGDILFCLTNLLQLFSQVFIDLIILTQ